MGDNGGPWRAEPATPAQAWATHKETDMKRALEQIEANVLIIIKNPSAMTMLMFPYWECEMNEEQLWNEALYRAHQMFLFLLV